MSDIGTVGKYTLRQVLGKGAMGVVYEAFDPMIERRVALKTIRKDLWEAEDGDELRERFLREARAAGRLVHPNIVTVYEFGEADGGAYIVMEHVAGRTLKEMTDAGTRFSADEAVRLMVPVLSALGYSHKAGVIHRDIKPANIMVAEDGVVKILDFGVARLASASITQVGTILGTPAYMAPEQLLGQTVDNRADLYSAGVILRELLCGQKTFQGDYGQVLRQVLYSDPAAPSAIDPTVPPAFDAIVARAMARQPEDRFASAQEFVEALRQPGAVVARARQSPPSKTRSPAVPLAAGVAALLAAAGGAYALGLFGGATPAPAPAPQQVAVAAPEPVVEKPAEPAKRAIVLEEPPPAPKVVEPPVVEKPVEPPVAEKPVEPPPPEPATVKAEPEPKPEPPATPTPTQAEVVAMLSKPVAEPPPPAAPPAKAKPPVLTVVTDRGNAPRYRVGETMHLTVTVERQAEVYCFYQSAAGDIMRVFPTRFAPDATVKAKQPLKLPGGQPFNFQFDRKNAREEVRCVGVEPATVAKLPKVFGGAGFEPLSYGSITALVEAIRRAAGEDIAAGGVVVTVD